MKKIIILTLLSFSINSYAVQFNFISSFFSKSTEIKNYGTYKAYANGSYAKSCNEYFNPLNNYRYRGDIGDGIYRIKPDDALAAIDVQCDMTTNGGGWTVIFDPANTINNCGSLLTANYGSCGATGIQQTTSVADGGNNLVGVGFSLKAQFKNIKFSQINVTQTGYCGFGDQLWGALITFNSSTGVSTAIYTTSSSTYIGNPNYYTPDEYNFGFDLTGTSLTVGDSFGNTSYGAQTVTFSKIFSSFVNNPITGINSITMQDGRNNGVGCNNKKMTMLKLK